MPTELIANEFGKDYICTMLAKLIGIERHRITTDGQGVTTLVAFHGCTLHCRYCLNPQCLNQDIVCRCVSPEDLLEEVSVDSLYFIATGGGITFGGGEPLLNSAFIAEFCKITDPQWQINIETSLNAETALLKTVLPYIDHFYIDIKDMNPHIYKAYTSGSNSIVKQNLHLLASQISPEKITIRLPLIPEYNNESDIQNSIKELKQIGFINFDTLKYIRTSVNSYNKIW